LAIRRIVLARAALLAALFAAQAAVYRTRLENVPLSSTSIYGTV